jgi:hypothetical protein
MVVSKQGVALEEYALELLTIEYLESAHQSVETSFVSDINGLRPIIDLPGAPRHTFGQLIHDVVAGVGEHEKPHPSCPRVRLPLPEIYRTYDALAGLGLHNQRWFTSGLLIGDTAPNHDIGTRRTSA